MSNLFYLNSYILMDGFQLRPKSTSKIKIALSFKLDKEEPYTVYV